MRSRARARSFTAAIRPRPFDCIMPQPGGVEQVGERRAQGASARQRLSDADELLDMGQSAARPS